MTLRKLKGVVASTYQGVSVRSGECRILFVDLTASTSLRPLRPFLSEVERREANSLRCRADRYAFLLCRGLLRCELAAIFPTHPLHLQRDEFGKPQLAAELNTDVSISHSSELGALAIGRGISVGIDVELRDRFHAASPTIVRALGFPSTSKGEPASLARRWVQREAYAKALGTGLVRGSFESVLPQAFDWPLGAPLPHIQASELLLDFTWRSNVGCLAVLGELRDIRFMGVTSGSTSIARELSVA